MQNLPSVDPQVGNLATPINSSDFSKALINNLPAYRAGLSPQRRGLEIGMAHGYLLFGPFAFTSQFRNTGVSDVVGLIEAVILVVILTVCLSLYAGVTITSVRAIWLPKPSGRKSISQRAAPSMERVWRSRG